MNGLLYGSVELGRRGPETDPGSKEVGPLEFRKRRGRLGIAARIANESGEAAIRIVDKP
jgi:hypothetical protein